MKVSSDLTTLTSIQMKISGNCKCKMIQCVINESANKQQSACWFSSERKLQIRIFKYSPVCSTFKYLRYSNSDNKTRMLLYLNIRNLAVCYIGFGCVRICVRIWVGSSHVKWQWWCEGFWRPGIDHFSAPSSFPYPFLPLALEVGALKYAHLNQARGSGEAL